MDTKLVMKPVDRIPAERTDTKTTKYIKTHWKCWTLTMFFWTFMIMQTACIGSTQCTSLCYIAYSCHGAIWSHVIVLVWLVLYVLEVYVARCSQYLWHTATNEEARQYITAMKQREANIVWRISCYHYVQQDKQIALRAHRKYKYSACTDKSRWSMNEIIRSIHPYGIMRLSFGLETAFANKESERDYNTQLESFIDEHKKKDVRYELQTHKTPDVGKTFYIEDPRWNRSKLMQQHRFLNRYCYILAAVFVLLPCYRTWMNNVIGEDKYMFQRYTFVKELNMYTDKEMLVCGYYRFVAHGECTETHSHFLPADIVRLIGTFCPLMIKQ